MQDFLIGWDILSLKSCYMQFVHMTVSQFYYRESTAIRVMKLRNSNEHADVVANSQLNITT